MYTETAREKYERLNAIRYGRSGGSAADRMARLKRAIDNGKGDEPAYTHWYA